jgi:D-3-phosphoglycerate dehydrogenase
VSSPNVLLLEKIHPDAEEAFVDAGLSVGRCDQALSGDDLLAALDGVRFLGLRSKSRVSADVLSTAPSLEAIGCYCIGTNQVDLNAAAAGGTAVFNSPFSNTRSVAEMTIAEIIALHRRLFDRSMQLHNGHWNKSATGAHEVRGRTIGIIGYGHIGSQVSVLAEALGMKVLFYDVLPRMAIGNAQPCKSLDALLQKSDVVTLHVPATPATHHLIGGRELNIMKPGASIINNARGTVVDLVALAKSIKDGRIGGAAIDVFPEEPGSNNDTFHCPLTGVDNVILTPHVGGSTEEAQSQIAIDVTMKLTRFATTGTTTTSVNIPEVYLPVHHPEHSRILHFHRNVPGVLSNLHAIIADAGANIHAEYLQSQGDVSYVILDIDAVKDTTLANRIGTLAETIKLRVL